MLTARIDRVLRRWPLVGVVGACVLACATANAQSVGTRRPADPDEENLSTLVQSASNGTMTTAELKRLAAKGYDRQVNHVGPFDPRWGDLIVMARIKGLVSDEEWKAYAVDALGFSCPIREKVRSGGLARIWLQAKSGRGSDTFQGDSILKFTEVRFDEHAASLPGPYGKWVMDFHRDGGIAGSAQWLRVDVPPGRYHVTIPLSVLRLTIWNQPGAGNLPFETLVDLGFVDVVGPEVKLVQPVDSSAIDDVFLTEKDVSLEIMNNWDTRGTPAIALSADGRGRRQMHGPAPELAMVSTPRLHVTFKDGTKRDVDLPPIYIQRSGPHTSDSCQAPVPPELGEIASIDVTFAPDLEAAEGIPGITRLWQGTLEFKNVPFDRRW